MKETEVAPPWSHHRVEIEGMWQHYLLAGPGEPLCYCNVHRGFLRLAESHPSFGRASHRYLTEEKPERNVEELLRFFNDTGVI